MNDILVIGALEDVDVSVFVEGDTNNFGLDVDFVFSLWLEVDGLVCCESGSNVYIGLVVVCIKEETSIIMKTKDWARCQSGI